MVGGQLGHDWFLDTNARILHTSPNILDTSPKVMMELANCSVLSELKHVYTNPRMDSFQKCIRMIPIHTDMVGTLNGYHIKAEYLQYCLYWTSIRTRCTVRTLCEDLHRPRAPTAAALTAHGKNHLHTAWVYYVYIYVQSLKDSYSVTIRR